MKNYLAIVASLAAAFMLSACVNELDRPIKLGENEIAFVVGGDQVATKAVSNAPVQMAPVSLGTFDGEELFLFESVSNLDDLNYVPQTKGTPIYTENIASYYKSILATPYEDLGGSSELTDSWGGSRTFPLDETVKDMIVYSYNYSKGQESNLAWPSNGKLLYFIEPSYANQNGVTDKKYYADGKISFKYMSPETAVDQKDLLFTSKHMTQATKDSDNKILLYHALTAVKFKAGNAGDNLTTIKKVVIKNIYSDGDCVITPGYEGKNYNASNENAGAVKSWDAVKWSNLSDKEDYEQAFSSTLVNGYGGQGSVPDSFSKDDTDKNNMNASDYSLTFNLVPQSVSGVEIVVTFEIGGATYTRTAKLPEGAEWKAGELHTYTVTMNQVDVDITDKVSGTVKSDVVTTNTGNLAAYLRCAIVPYWSYGTEHIVVDNISGVNITLGTDWVKAADGFYYYKHAVAPQKAAKNNIFSSYDASGLTIPFRNAHLEMAIAVQAVRYDSDKKFIKEAWGNAAASLVGTDVE